VIFHAHTLYGGSGCGERFDLSDLLGRSHPRDVSEIDQIYYENALTHPLLRGIASENAGVENAAPSSERVQDFKFPAPPLLRLYLLSQQWRIYISFPEAGFALPKLFRRQKNGDRKRCDRHWRNDQCNQFCYSPLQRQFHGERTV